MSKQSTIEGTIIKVSATIISLAGLLIFLEGCQAQRIRKTNSRTFESNKIEQLQNRIEILEKKLTKNNSRLKNDLKTPKGPIRSLTIRTGTTDDRLRIYWEDGRKSDLPCTKEQSIWACG